MDTILAFAPDAIKMTSPGAYVLPGGQTIWIITEADRRATTFLLPGDY
ncbi:plasmid related protein [Ralstonia solanacearum]|nr:plasmid related protein [Ralstonia solanacearum]